MSDMLLLPGFGGGTEAAGPVAWLEPE